MHSLRPKATGAAPRTVPAERPSADGKSLREATILIVDDDVITIDVLQTFLEDAGYRNVLSSSEPREAVEIMSREHPDVLLLDLVMPGMTGFEILEQVRADDVLQHMPVIVLTSATDPETKLRSLEMGASDFLGKPVDPSELALRLRNTLAAKAYQDRLAHYDALTGLANRRLFLERLETTLSRAGRRDRRCAVLHVDLDRFKPVNDALGAKAGDALLQDFSTRIFRCLEDNESHVGGQVGARCEVARLGGDEFAVLLADMPGVESATHAARRILDAISEPFEAGGQELHLAASIGISVFPDDGDDRDSLLTHADAAMSHAKRIGGNRFQFYSEEINARSFERLKTENELRRGIGAGEFVLYFQPKVDIATGRARGAEALIRWRHPQRGMVPPGEFIPLAEEAGLITDIGTWVVHEACRVARAWADEPWGPVCVSVNVSTQQFTHGDLVGTVREALGASGLDPRLLSIELTESLLMHDAEESIEALCQLKALGVSLSIDDFGTGYSSLSYLKRFPLDEIKIDQSFVSHVHEDANDAGIVTAVIAMGHALGLKVVAEGVELREQLEFLKARRCDECQGFLFSRPVPAEQFASLGRPRPSPVPASPTASGASAPSAAVRVQRVGVS